MKPTTPISLPELPSPELWSVDEPERAFDAYFEPLREVLGRDHLGYRGHCQRVYVNMAALAPTLDLTPVIPALVFRDLAMWTHRTIDYLEPSAQLARDGLTAIDREDWIEPITAMILRHHKQRAYREPREESVDPVRRGDMGDFTLGLQGRVPREALQDGRGRYPDAGSHRMLMRRPVGRLLTKPWSPLPMLRRRAPGPPLPALIPFGGT